MSCDLEEYSKSHSVKKVKCGCHNLDCLSFATVVNNIIEEYLCYIFYSMIDYPSLYTEKTSVLNLTR